MAEELSNNRMLINERIHEGSDNKVGWNGRHDVDVEKWADSLARKLEEVPQYMCRSGHPGRITRIPENLREVDVKAYEPYLVSIGPYHHDKPMVQSMEKTKRVVLKCVLKAKPEITLKDYLREIKSIEPEARSFYSDTEMGSEKFVWMLLVDSIYILTSFCGMVTKKNRINQTLECSSDGYDSRNSHIMESDDSIQDISEDNIILLLYSTSFQHDLSFWRINFLFFVLQKIYTLIYGDSEKSLTSIIKDRVADLLLGYAKLDPETVISPTTEVHHLLHLCHMFFQPTIQHVYTTYQFPGSSQTFRLGSAVQLYEAGVNFVARSGSAQYSLLDITFNSGKMIMPSLCVDDNTNSLLRNLIALEQMKYPSMGLNVSAYAVLLLHLVTTPEDAQHLRRKEVIQHHLASDKDMMYLVNKLSVGLSFDYVEDMYSLKPVFQKLHRYSEHRVPRWRAGFKHKYFHNPWTVISLLAALVLLILTVVQTYYAVYSYYHPYFDGHS